MTDTKKPTLLDVCNALNNQIRRSAAIEAAINGLDTNDNRQRDGVSELANLLTEDLEDIAAKLDELRREPVADGGQHADR